MKSTGAIRQKFKQAKFRAVKVMLQTHLEERPTNCSWNEEFMHPKANGVPVGICSHPEQDKDRLCDEGWGGCEKAKSCPLFEPVQDKDTLKAEFKEFLATAPLSQIAKEYPDLAALLWVLDEEAPGRESSTEWEEEEPTDPQRAVPLPEPPVTSLQETGTGERSNPEGWRDAPAPSPETFWQKLWGLIAS